MKITQAIFEEIETKLLNKMQLELRPEYCYHNADHTRYVIAAAIKIADWEGVNGEELLLLKTAALYHDSGYLIHHKEHEALSVQIAQQELAGYKVDEEQIKRIAGLIMATKLPQKPIDILSRILCDADLFYLGTDDFDEISGRLFKELQNLGRIESEHVWIRHQVKFLKKHRYHNKSVVAHVNRKKELHLHQNILKLNNMNHHKNSGHILNILADATLLIIGVLLASVGLKGFLVPNHFFDGGVTGISLLMHELYHWNLGMSILLLNLPLWILSYFTVGRRFAIMMFISVVAFGICLQFMPNFGVTHDKLLIAVFGGAFLGIGVGLVMRVGGALDGIEVLAIGTLKKTSFSISEIILGINIVIFAIAAFVFGPETALYSILTYFTATRCIDYVVEGLQAYTGVTIISSKSEELKHHLVNRMGRAITIYKGERGYLPGNFDIKHDCDIVFTIITRLEMRKLKNLIAEIDPNAFVVASSIREASGGILTRKSAH